MNISSLNIIPVTQARTKLGDLAEKVSGEQYIILTKGGNPKAALVDIDYLNRLEEEVRQLSQKTFIDKKLLPYTREFTDAEIATWKQEDSL